MVTVTAKLPRHRGVDVLEGSVEPRHRGVDVFQRSVEPRHRGVDVLEGYYRHVIEMLMSWRGL